MPSLMKRPNSCPGSECPGCSSANCMAEGGNVESGKSRHDYEWGINKPFGGAGHSSGTSDQGLDVRAKEYGAAKSDAKNILHQMKWQKGQDRTNLAEGGSVEKSAGITKGVHKSDPRQNNSGQSYMGTAVRHGDTSSAKKMVYDKTKEARPLGKNHGYFAEGGEVSDHDEMHEMLGHELMEAFDKKDKKGVFGAIEACVMRRMNKE
jgi:hypothetical protein